MYSCGNPHEHRVIKRCGSQVSWLCW